MNARASLFAQLSWASLLCGVALSPFTTLRADAWWLLADVAFVLAALFAVAGAGARRGAVWLPWWLVIGLALFALGPFLSALPDGVMSARDFLSAANVAFCVFLIPFVVANQPQADERRFATLLLVWIGANLAGALVAVLQARGLPLGPLEDSVRKVGHRVAGLNLSPSSLGYYVALMAPMCLALALGSRNWVRFALWLATAGFFLYVADLSGSRGALVAGMCAGAFVAGLFALRRTALTTRFLQTLAIVVALALLWNLRSGLELSAVERLLGTTPNAAMSDAERAVLRDMALQGFWDRPIFGSGYEVSMVAHDILLSVLHSAGIVGLAAFLLAQAGCAAYAFRLMRLALLGLAPYGIAAGLAGTWLAWIVLGLRATPLLDRVPFVGFGLAVLYCLVLARRDVRTVADGFPAAGPGAMRSPAHPFEA